MDYNIELIHYEDWEEAKDELRQHQNKYAAVILDVMGKLDKDAKGEDPSHISTAIRDISRINRNLKYYILTAFFKKINDNNFLPHDEKIYKKNESEDELLDDIRKKFSDSEKFEVAKKHPVELEFIEGYFLDDQIKQFIRLFGSKQEEQDSSEAHRILRVLNERAMDVLGLYFLNFDSIEEYFDEVKNKNSDARIGGRTIHFLKYFSERSGVEVPTGIYGTITNIYKTASSSAAHSPGTKSYRYSSNMISSLKLGFLETIMWMSDLIEKQEEKERT